MRTRTLHPFPARMAPEIALDAIPELTDQPLTVIDPMCGSGTVLGVAVTRGHHAVGEDIDPLAVMMSRLAISPVDVAAVESAALGVVASARNDAGRAPWGDDQETGDFVDFWFGDRQKHQLIALTTAIQALDEGPVSLTLRMAVSRIIVTKSPQASLAADTSHSRPHRVLTNSDYDVYSGFARSVSQLLRVLALRDIRGSGRVQLGDARVLASIEAGSADLAVTSPPYLNALDYLRGHRLALVWFGYGVGELRSRRSTSIGAERGLGMRAPETVHEIVSIVTRSVDDPSALKLPMIERFAHDCLAFSAQLHRALKQNSRAVLVVGNSTLRGNYIENDVIARRAMEHAGFELVNQREREIPPNKRYMAINTADRGSAMSKRMRTEIVLTMEKS